MTMFNTKYEFIEHHLYEAETSINNLLEYGITQNEIDHTVHAIRQLREMAKERFFSSSEPETTGQE